MTEVKLVLLRSGRVRARQISDIAPNITRKPSHDSAAQRRPCAHPSGNTLDKVSGGFAPMAGILQAKLAVGAVNDPREHEADRVADRVMRMPEPTYVSGWPEQISRKCVACEEEDKDDEHKLQTKRAEPTPVAGAAPPAMYHVLASAGQPLDAKTRAFFESRFGADFSTVRIHHDQRAADSARHVNAHAYTVSNHIVFAANQYQPTEQAGRQLLAHELTHVIQQTARPTPKPARHEKTNGGPAKPTINTCLTEGNFSGEPGRSDAVASSWSPQVSLPVLSEMPNKTEPMMRRADNTDAGVADTEHPPGGTFTPYCGPAAPAAVTYADGNKAGVQMSRASTQSGLIPPTARMTSTTKSKAADRVANQVLRIPESSITAESAQISRKCATCEEEEAQTIRTKRATSEAPTGDAPAIVTEVLQSPGRALESGVREFMEPRLGHDLSHVRIHTQSLASRSAEAVAARAYTIGRHVVFRHGEYAPSTHEGRRLLAHELAHVLQQRPASASVPKTLQHSQAAAVSPRVQRQAIQQDYTASKERTSFATNVEKGDWENAYNSLNSLSMYEMLRALATLDAATRTQLWAQRTSLTGSYFFDRIKYALDVVDTRQLPAVAPGDLAATGQVDDAQKFIAESSADLRAALRAAVKAKSSYDQLHDLIALADESKKAAVLADHALLKSLHDAVFMNEVARLIELLGRKAPSGAELVTNTTVVKALDAAWKASHGGAASGRHEEGGYILMDLITGDLSVLPAGPGRTGRDPGPSVLAMQLPDPTVRSGLVCVANFHTHPNPEPGFEQGCNPSDDPTFQINGVPGLIRSAGGTVACGPERRAHLGGARGYPGPSGGDAP
jgi:hypothetical protein